MHLKAPGTLLWDAGSARGRRAGKITRALHVGNTVHHLSPLGFVGTMFSGEKNAPTSVLESKKESSLVTDFIAGIMLMSPDISFHRIWDNLQNCCCG